MIVDANVLASAFLGRSMPLLVDMVGRGFQLLVPMHQYAESRLVAVRKGGWDWATFNVIAASVVTVLPVEAYGSCEEIARSRLGPRGQPDWPVLAAALVSDDEIWSNDRDFFGVGVPVWTTKNVQFAEIES